MHFLESLEIIFIASAVVILLLHRLRMPSLVGFLVAGVIIGPYGVGLVKETHAVELLAEIGVVLLLFAIGIEFSLTQLGRMKKVVVGGGGIQVAVTIAAAALLAFLFTSDMNRSIFFGFLVALSSTAIVLKMLVERGEIDSPHGRIMVGILIFQDLCVVPLMLLAPVLGGESVSLLDIGVKMAKAAAIIVAVLVSARWIVPALLHQVVHTKSRELFITTIILICLGIALLTSRFGLSLALGAFLAGLVISDSEYAHQATADILPFKESFIGLFFVSVGMLLNTGYVVDHFGKVALGVLLIFVVKASIGAGAALVIGSPLRTALHAGFGLAQIGEFSFVLALTGRSSGLITDDAYQIFLSASVITMMLTPFIMKKSPVMAEWLVTRRALRWADRATRAMADAAAGIGRMDHVIIVGFGLNGRNLARVLKEADIPYLVLEMNSDTVREMKKKGEPIYYGDGTSAEILHQLGVMTARLLVVAISDPASTRRIVSIARHENPDLKIVVRTKYIVEVDDLEALGADEVIPEEFETSIEIFSRVLHAYQYPRNVIAEMVERVRGESYTALRRPELPRRRLFDEVAGIAGIEVDGVRLPEDSPLSGQSIAALRVRKETGVTIIAVRRSGEIIANPDPAFTLQPGDVILYTGERAAMDRAARFFRHPVEG